MQTKDYLRLLVEQIHSAVIATIGADGHPQTRVIDMMLWDDKGVYFLTAKGKAFYEQLMKQKYISLSATKDKYSISLRGEVTNIGSEKLDEIFEKNPYMQQIYPEDTRSALEVFAVYEAEGEFFDISDPSCVTRDSFVVGNIQKKQGGYFVGEGCIGCKLCYSVCPQKCIDISQKPVVIAQNHCLHCGRCAEICPKQVIEKR
ncbi:MAG: 4Fe-4S binding protein [Marvinbryantia sp.]|uniref:pyridoxamine 5'-phosphate oxidase family protein n=1 Tax=Marvinbryantia sp. TaxID=2496532 RepID=UPI0025E58A35|nr:4Fe-4S binding protein [uncultured Marvinbryantia sp.]